MQNTPNYKLNKPDGNDYAKIESLNENADIIDEELKRISKAIGNGSAGNDILSRLDTLEKRVGNLNNLETTQKANLVEAINEVRKSAINAWQKGVYNDTNIINLGNKRATKVFTINQADWKNTGNVEQLVITLPIQGAFSGVIKATYSAMWGVTESWGATEVVYNIGDFNTNGITLNDFTIMTASEVMLREFKILQPYINPNTGNIALLVLRAPNANNPLQITITVDGTYNSTTYKNNVFAMLNDGFTTTADLESPTAGGHPWIPQKSQIPTNSKMNFWDTSMWNDIIDGRTFKFAGGTHNVANFTPEQFRNVLDSYLFNKMGTFKCLLPSSDLGLTNLMDMYGVLTTIKPWTDESGGGLKQRFETSDVIFKRYQINATTWSAWVCMQSKDVDIIKLFQSASDVKKNVAQAITDKGVPTSPDATGAQMANNIRAIKTGRLDSIAVTIPGVPPNGVISVAVATDFYPWHAMMNLDGVVLRNGVITGNNWANRFSVYNIRVVFNSSNLWSVYFDIRGGLQGASEQTNTVFLAPKMD